MKCAVLRLAFPSRQQALCRADAVLRRIMHNALHSLRRASARRHLEMVDLMLGCSAHRGTESVLNCSLRKDRPAVTSCYRPMQNLRCQEGLASTRCDGNVYGRRRARSEFLTARATLLTAVRCLCVAARHPTYPSPELSQPRSREGPGFHARTSDGSRAEPLNEAHFLP
jgi:hypothetical protein